MHRPVVLVVGREIESADGVRGAAFGAGRKYSESIVRAGGVPVLLPPIPMDDDDYRSIVESVDAVVLHGGGDIDPARYRQSPTTEHLYGINARHDEVELAVMGRAVELERPTLAICRGLQILNVALGGTLHQHIDRPGHRQEFHPVSLEPGSRAALATGTDRPDACHSYHHQAIDELGRGLRVTGRHSDGTIEAVELDGATWIVGVQWHPEDSAADDPQQQGLFDALVGECRHD